MQRYPSPNVIIAARCAHRPALTRLSASSPGRWRPPPSSRQHKLFFSASDLRNSRRGSSRWWAETRASSRLVNTFQTSSSRQEAADLIPEPLLHPPRLTLCLLSHRAGDGRRAPPPRPPPHYLLYLMGPLLFPHTHLFLSFRASTLTLRVTVFNIVGET